MTASHSFPIATRRSPLAQAQALLVKDQLIAATANMGQYNFDIETFVSTGDQRLVGSLADVGGKGLFTKEIEQALLDGEARIAVHSMKDMPVLMAPGLVLGAIPAREDPRDSFICDLASTPDDLPQGAILGTASVRRAAQSLRRRPDLKIIPLRGNIGTRLEKIRLGVADATFLAEAGLKRAHRTDVARHILAPELMLPALGQGALCIQVRADDPEALALVRLLACEETEICLAGERAFLAELDGSCRTPLAGLATLDGGEVSFKAELLSLDGSYKIDTEIKIAVTEKTHELRCQQVAAAAREAAQSLFAQVPGAIKTELGL